MKSVFHINSYFFSNKLHFQLVKKIASNQIKQNVFIPIEKKFKYKQIMPINGVKFTIIEAFTKYDKYIWPFKIFKIWLKLRTSLKNNNIRLIHAHSLFVNGSLALLANYFFKTPYIVTIRNSDINTFISRSIVFREIGKLILNKAELITTLSHSYFNFQLKKFYSTAYFKSIQTKHFVIPNGADDFWFDNKYKNKGIDATLRVLFVGLVAENKNLDAVIITCEKLYERGINLELHIAGDGRRLEEFKKKNLNFPIYFYGHISDKYELLGIYRKCHILFVPSFTESFGIVYIEAMTQSLPVIYTKNQGFDGFFESGKFGFAVNPKDYIEMAEAILKITKNYIYFSKNSYEMADHFKWDKPIQKLSEIYDGYLTIEDEK